MQRMLALSLLSRDKIRQSVKFWSSKCRECLHYLCCYVNHIQITHFVLHILCNQKKSFWTGLAAIHITPSSSVILSMPMGALTSRLRLQTDKTQFPRALAENWQRTEPSTEHRPRCDAGSVIFRLHTPHNVITTFFVVRCKITIFPSNFQIIHENCMFFRYLPNFSSKLFVSFLPLFT